MPTTRRRTVFITITTILAVTIVFHSIGFLSPIERFIRKSIAFGTKPLYQLSISLSDETLQFDSVQSLEDAYVKIKTEYANAQIDKSRLEQLEQENEEFRKQLSFFSDTSFEHVGAQVIGKSVDPLERSIILDVGEQQGITIGNPVVVQEGIFIGRVVAVHEQTAIVRLINDNESRIAVTVQNSDKSIGLIEGGFGLSVRMTLIPQNEVISLGETIITSGLNDGLPRGLVIGTIEVVEKEAYQPFQEAVITPLAQLDKLEFVSVIPNSENSNLPL